MTHKVGFAKTATLKSTHQVLTIARNMHAKLILGMALLAGFGIPPQMHSQDCTSFAGNIINDFGSIQAGDEGLIQVNMVSNRSDGRYVSYGEMPSISGNNGSGGFFAYHPASIFFPAYLQGTLSQFFSDRRFSSNVDLSYLIHLIHKRRIVLAW